MISYYTAQAGQAFVLCLSSDTKPDSTGKLKFLVETDTGTMFTQDGTGGWNELATGGGGANWGEIAGTLSNQTDLQNALNAKASAASLATVATSGAYADLSGKPTIPRIDSARVGADRTTTVITLADVVGLLIPMLANETWSFEAHLTGGCSSTGGSQHSLTVPVGATVRASVFGNAATATAFNSGVITASDGAGPTLWNANAQGRIAVIRGLVVNGANAGNIQIRFKSVTATQTTTVNANSYITGRKH